MRAWMLGLIVGAAVASGATGCGSEDESTSAAEPATGGEPQGPSRAEFVARADPICSQAKRSIDIARSKFHHGNLDQADAAELAAFVHDDIAPVYRSEVTALGRLPVPAGDRARIDELLGQTEAAVVKLEADPELIGPRGGSPLFDDANRLARDYGLAVCVAPE